MTYDDFGPVQPEHECPVPLERPVREWGPGGQLWSPAGRWETIVAVDTRRSGTQTLIYTDKTGNAYAWSFWPSDKMPYLPAYTVTLPPAEVMVVEVGHHLEAVVASSIADARWARGHVLVSAQLVRGSGWLIQDKSNGADFDQITVESKAKARAEVNRRARAHAKALGVPFHREQKATPSKPKQAPTVAEALRTGPLAGYATAAVHVPGDVTTMREQYHDRDLDELRRFEMAQLGLVDEDDQGVGE